MTWPVNWKGWLHLIVTFGVFWGLFFLGVRIDICGYAFCASALVGAFKTEYVS